MGRKQRLKRPAASSLLGRLKRASVLLDRVIRWLCDLHNSIFLTIVKTVTVLVVIAAIALLLIEVPVWLWHMSTVIAARFWEAARTPV